ncbi:MAG: hypothetical protein ACRD0W_04730 [Acidimicrobiales bacterium]
MKLRYRLVRFLPPWAVYTYWNTRSLRDEEWDRHPEVRWARGLKEMPLNDGLSKGRIGKPRTHRYRRRRNDPKEEA